MPNINALAHEDMSVFEKVELASLDSLSPSKRSDTTAILEFTGKSIVDRVKRLHEGGYEVDRQVIHDLEPMIPTWSREYYVLSNPEFKRSVQALGARNVSENDYGFYDPDSKLAIIRSPDDKWDNMSIRKKNEIRRTLSLEDIDDVRSVYTENILIIFCLEEFIHRFGNDDHIFRQISSQDSHHKINERVVYFFNETMTKILVKDYYPDHNPDLIKDTYNENMIAFIELLPYRKLFEIVYFGSNDPQLTYNLISLIQQRLLEQFPSMSIEQILTDTGYFVPDLDMNM